MTYRIDIIRKRYAKTAAVIALLLWLPLFYAASVKAEDTSPSAPSGMSLMMQNEHLAFYMDTDNTQFALTRKDDGTTFFSNPRTGSAPSDDNAMELASLFSVAYYNTVNSLQGAMNSYKDSVLMQQFTVEEPAPGALTMAVHYEIGDGSATFLPRVFLPETFETYIMESEALTDEEKTDLNRNFRLLDERSVSRLPSQTDRDLIYDRFPEILNGLAVMELRQNVNLIVMRRLAGYIQRTGFTVELYEQDLEVIQPVDIVASKPTYYITLEFTLDGDGLVVRIPQSGFASRDNFMLTEITLLRYFGAVQADTPGFIFVPDGAGAVIETGNPLHRGMTPVGLQMYGADKSKDLDIPANNEFILAYTSLMPVYGVSGAGGGLFAIIEQCQSGAYITARPPNLAIGYYSVSSTFTVLSKDTLLMRQLRLLVNTFSYIFPKKSVTEDIQIRYAVLPPEACGYADMARFYQGYLEQNGTIRRLPQDEPYPFVAEFLGGVEKTRTFFGIRFKSMQPLTTYGEVADISGRLIADGVRALNVKYRAWCNGGYFHTLNDRLNPISALGGKKGFTELVRTLNGFGVDFYPDVDLLYVGKNTLFDGFNANKHASRTIIQKVAFTGIASPVSSWVFGMWGHNFLVSPAYAVSILRSALNYVTNLGLTSLSLGEYGATVQSDYRANAEVTRSEAMAYALENFELLRDTGKNVLIEGGAAAYVGYASMVVRMPLSDSGYRLVDYSVPFMQMVLHGYVNYTGETHNLTGDLRRNLLETAETGAGLAFTWIASPDAVLVGTDLVDLYYNVHYGNWYDEAVALYSRYAEVFDGLQALRITGHQRLAGGLTVTEYENGGRVAVNYGFQAVELDGYTVPPRDFIYVG